MTAPIVDGTDMVFLWLCFPRAEAYALVGLWHMFGSLEVRCLRFCFRRWPRASPRRCVGQAQRCVVPCVRPHHRSCHDVGSVPAQVALQTFLRWCIVPDYLDVIVVPGNAQTEEYGSVVDAIGYVSFCQHAAVVLHGVWCGVGGSWGA